MIDVRERFPGLANGWARLDGPAGTQVVDTAIEAAAAWQRSGNNANSHGPFAAAHECDALVARTQATLAELLGGDAGGFMFGPSTTANVFSLTRAIGRTLDPDDEIVCTRLDHDSNISPWLEVAADTDARVRLADFDTSTGRLPVETVAAQLSDRTRWVAVTGASNAIGTMPDISAITRQAHAAGAKVMVDGVHLTPHAPVGIAAIGCDIYSTSSYKWYGPHAGITWIEPGLRHGLVPYKVRPADDDHVDRFQLGTPAYETIAAIDAAAHFLLDTGMDSIAAHEREVFGVLLDGLLSLPGVEVLGPYSLEQRAPTLAFTMSGRTDNEIAIALADARVAVWDGHYYAIEVMAAYGIEGAVRAGIAAYVSLDDVYRLLDVVSSL